ncbi:MAG TPA: NAD-dependent epimerase/dehydratase family protein [Mycobacteriales bacterium]|jgi:nucleoside-diphosphate-sugar epimerase|nr:NAD-dependent epimerase/dehydratase family protein [Mycobacteriales bacterium]
MRIAVTGATGNVGTALLTRLNAAPEVSSVVGIARRLPGESTPPYRHVSWQAVDIARVDAESKLRQAFAGADAVVHLAWALQPNRDESAMRRTNVFGTARVLAAAADAEVAQVVVASSVGAYSLGPKRRRVDESWPTGGIHTSHYSRFKAINERALDVFESEHPDIILTRLRPGLIFQSDAGAEIAGLFFGSRFPTRWFRQFRPGVLPLPSQFIVQAVHASDVADAYWRAIERRAAGAFNVAAEPVLTPVLIARAIGAKSTIPFRAAVLRAIVDMTWRAGIQATDPGWLDLATALPIMSTERARRELGWSPAVSSVEAIAEIVDAVADRSNKAESAPLRG